MKNRRHKMNREIVEQQNIETQYQLTEELMKHGFNVTQATISRDIKELGLVKVASANNTFRYGFQPGVATINTFDRTKKMLRDNVLKMEIGHNIIVMKTLPGTAQGVAFCLDSLGWKELLGTLAGDDAIFLVASDACEPRELVEKIHNLML